MSGARAQGRIWDYGMCKEHVIVGRAARGSSNVLVNQRAALRDRDLGYHSRSSRSNPWITDDGAPCVLINDRRAFRVGDRINHSQRNGELVSGSSNVLVGDYGAWAAGDRPAEIIVTVLLNRFPLPGVLVSTSSNIAAKTNKLGIALLKSIPSGATMVSVDSQHIWTLDVHGGERIRLRCQFRTLAVGCCVNSVRSRTE